MLNNGMWGVFSLPDPRNKEKRWDLLLHQSIFPLDYVRSHVQSLLKGSEADQYVVQNLAWSGVYLKSTFIKYSSSEGTDIGATDSNGT